jgi:hypothetical protein
MSRAAWIGCFLSLTYALNASSDLRRFHDKLQRYITDQITQYTPGYRPFLINQAGLSGQNQIPATRGTCKRNAGTDQRVLLACTASMKRTTYSRDERGSKLESPCNVWNVFDDNIGSEPPSNEQQVRRFSKKSWFLASTTLKLLTGKYPHRPSTANT